MPAKIENKTFIHDSAVLLGNVEIGDNSSIWPNAVLRADKGSIRIGERTSIQDCCVLHADWEQGIEIGSNVTVGHGTVVHACSIGDNCLIGMNSTVMTGVKLKGKCIVGAGAVVTKGIEAENALILGVPGKIIRELKESELKDIERKAQEYVDLKEKYLARQNV